MPSRVDWPSPVAVVKQVFGVRIIDGDNRVTQHAVFGHGTQPDDPGGSLLGAADNIADHIGAFTQGRSDQIRAIVHGELRFVVQSGIEVPVVRLIVFALDGKNRNPVIAHQAGGNVILSRERIGSTKDHIGAAIAQGDHQVRRLAGDVETGGNANALERLVLDEFLADELQNLHGLIGPLDALLAEIGQFHALYIT